MNPVDQGSQDYPPCGYGLLGLCCSDCLRGPCRISPFEKTQALCGAESELLVAGNLCRLAAGDFVRVLKSFTQAVGEFKKKSKAPSKALTESLARKYGIPGKELIPFLKKETTRLLDPLADQPPLPFSSLFPERAFSRDHSGKRSAPLLAELFGLFNWKSPQEEDPEALLRRCLDSAASMLIVEELTRDILSLVSKTEREKGGWANPSNLPNSVKPVVLSLVETEGLRSAEMQRLATSLKEISGVLSISLRGTEGLIRLCHSLQEKWHRPIPELPVVVLVESPNILPILAPLALGLATISDPSLPIRGSKKVEDFFYSGLSKVTGNFYLPVTDETVLSRLSRVLGRKL
jgi:hypothetical protein